MLHRARVVVIMIVVAMALVACGESTPINADTSNSGTDAGTPVPTESNDSVGTAPRPDATIPPNDAPMGLAAAEWPTDSEGVVALLSAMPEELNGLKLHPWEGPIDTERISVSYGPRDDLGRPHLAIVDLTNGGFFPTNWTAGDVVALQAMSDDAATIGQDGDLAWASGQTTESRADETPETNVPLHTVIWGPADGVWLFSAGASDPETLEQLVAATVNAAGS